MTSETELVEWRRRVFSLYEGIRASDDPNAAWETWKAARNELFAHHPQSPLTSKARAEFDGLGYLPYSSKHRVTAQVASSEPARFDIPTSGASTFGFTRFATVHFALQGNDLALELYWLDGYGGGLWLPFRDGTSGTVTYGAGRYLLDTVKGSDLGMVDGRLVLDFNFAYNPSCAYDPAWVCPLAPPPNHLDIDVEAGERAPEQGCGAPALDLEGGVTL